LAEAHIRALAPGVRGYFNLGTGVGCSVRQVIEVCEEVTGRAIRRVEKARRAGDPPSLVASPEAARRALDWSPRIPSIRDIVASAWTWHLRHPTGYPD